MQVQRYLAMFSAVLLWLGLLTLITCNTANRQFLHENDEFVATKNVDSDTLYFESARKDKGLKEAANNNCTISIVESIPQNLTYKPDEYIHPSTYSGLKALLELAKESVHIASYYWTLRGKDVDFYDETADEGEDIFNTLMDLGMSKKISIKIVQNEENNDTALLAEKAFAEVQTLNVTRLLNSGILHTKFWVIDGQHFYIGSANLDWRSLTQVKELGVLVWNCSCLAKDVEKLFDVYWYLSKPDSSIPPVWPPNYATSINMSNPAVVSLNNTKARIYISSSPPQFCAPGRTKDLEAITHVIEQAELFINIAVMDYLPVRLYSDPGYWSTIDDALRQAASSSRFNITVRLLASKWNHTMHDMYAYLCSLAVLRSALRISVKLFEVPVYSEDQEKIPYSRVNHNKYMVTDKHAYIGTSNWVGDYFITTAGVAVVVDQPQYNTTRGNLRKQLEDVFMRDWHSPYSHFVNCSHCPHLEQDGHAEL
ncbi:phospholipase D3-like isoform X2 [Pomacea canaliculata]|nr:phospholipase D3-like isoform X2 [Pomacea canaliculata]XP_025104715.1 phospholipase D3-like isoform X2 [Pomacea canaliculata]XP_025104716.1 phospholipase D3-like isoform X2 [Pomacea canaliculata]